jgi:hypothetical protein
VRLPYSPQTIRGLRSCGFVVEEDPGDFLFVAPSHAVAADPAAPMHSDRRQCLRPTVPRTGRSKPPTRSATRGKSRRATAWKPQPGRLNRAVKATFRGGARASSSVSSPCTCAQVSFHWAPPAPFETSAARPPTASARRQRFADIRDTGTNGSPRSLPPPLIVQRRLDSIPPASGFLAGGLFG